MDLVKCNNILEHYVHDTDANSIVEIAVNLLNRKFKHDHMNKI